ncbi:hypothetical protein LX64_04188 [Chitinophaga skermanii]|uniref:Uncharacterized protein n=1 Tax=Chitinophaga skermanii TaxID=331697 RepID=A0A327QA45_9BACT|nr:hypothetical protein [Chitinophaga skermanii]RAJ00482.1 hypothetical protein LX64_04188 [Chitinophaga skermanii]
MINTITPTGYFSLTVYHNNGAKEFFEEKNLVVTNGRTIIAKLLTGQTNAKISSIGFGSNSKPAELSDVELTDITLVPIMNVTFPTNNSIQFDYELPNDAGNGMQINEFGLFTDTNELFARKVRTTPIMKTSAVRLVGSWTITIN